MKTAQTSLKKPLVLGFGELIFDHVFIHNRDDTQYSTSRGGGTFANILANLAQLGLNTMAMGVFGTNTPYGTLAKKDLEQLSVDTTYLQAITGKSSQIINQIVDKTKGEIPEHQFTGICPVCKQKIPNNKLAITRYFSQQRLPAWSQISAVVMDKLTNDRLSILELGNRHNPKILTVVDIGRMGHLRYQPAGKIISDLNKFQIAFLDYKFFSRLLNRLQPNLENLGNLFEPFGQLQLIVVLKGEEGLDFCVKNFKPANKCKSITPPQFESIKDPAGAGDALIAHFIYSLLNEPCDTSSLFEIDRVFNALNHGVGQLDEVLNGIGARGHLDSFNLFNQSPTLRFRNSNLKEIKSAIRGGTCPFCFYDNKIKPNPRPNKNNKGNTTSSMILSQMSRRVLFSLEREDVLDKCRMILSKPGKFYVLGTGGSFPAAKFVSQVISTETENIAQAMRPYDYYKGMGQYTDWVLIISHSGSTSDCELAIKRAKEIGVPRIALITHPQRPRLANLLNESKGDVLISYGAKGTLRERGFVSFAGTIIPSAIFIASALNGKLKHTSLAEMFEKRDIDCKALRKIAETIESTGIIEVFGSGFAWPAMLDIESKSLEGRICYTQLHESKDFSHGRFMQSLNKRGAQVPKLLIQIKDDEYENLLEKALKASGAPFLKLRSENEGLIGGLELLIKVQYLINKLAIILFKNSADLSKPKRSEIPSSGLELYRWKPD